ncbi:MAG: SDR family oxidoreductase [Candidatus Eisenbacteria bacterium]|nr:SDR family oxidoreductase [Candidatus Eisenbacteria bacterium]
MRLGLEGKGALVTGASAGLGLGAAHALVEEGASVVLCARGESRLSAAVEALSRMGRGKVSGIVGDVAVPAEPARIFRDAERAAGPISILVANAGGPKPGFLGDLSESDWEAAFHLTLMSAVRLAKAALPGMVERGWGRIVFITSVSVKQPIDGLLLSNTLRPGVVGFAKSLAREVGPRGVTVNCVCPGPYNTERIVEVLERRAEKAGIDLEESRRRYLEDVPAGRFGEPIELGRAIAFLASTEAAFVNGVALSVDGGSVKGLFG